MESLWGKEIHLAPAGEVCHIVFVNEILAEFRNRGLNLTQLAQSRAIQDGITTSDSRALPHLARFLTDPLQAWIPNPQHQAQVQATIATLQAELSALKACTIPNRSLQRASIYINWFYNLTLERTILATIEKHIVAVDKWWQAQPEDATMSTYRLATCFGVPVSKITTGQNEHVLLILRVAVTLTSWLSKVLKTTRSMTSIMPALTLCKHQIGILASSSPLTLSSSINIFFAYRILQTRLMILYVQHYPQANGKLVAILRGATCTRHLYGTTLLAHQQFSRSFFEPNAVYLRFTCIAKHQPLF